jgi:hypothetical protein
MAVTVQGEERSGIESGLPVSLDAEEELPGLENRHPFGGGLHDAGRNSRAPRVTIFST